MDESFRCVMVFTGDPLPDVNRRAMAVEPMTCPPNAFRSGTDLITLEPGASWTGAWGIRATSARA
jgi:aldose 1-epimerase